MWMLFPSIIVTYAYICFSGSSTTHRRMDSPPPECSPTITELVSILRFGTALDARLLSTPCRSTSELLRTL